MDERLLKKLQKILSKLGVGDKYDEVVETLNEKDEDEEVVASDDAKVETEEVKPEAEDVKVEETEVETPVEDEGDKVEGEVVEAKPEAEKTEEVPTETEAVVEETPVDPFVEFNSRLEKYEEVNNALEARLASLEEALKKANVIETPKDEAVGIDQNSTPANKSVGSFQETLDKFNRMY